jgi:hypothetical protein
VCNSTHGKFREPLCPEAPWRSRACLPPKNWSPTSPLLQVLNDWNIYVVGSDYLCIDASNEQNTISNQDKYCQQSRKQTIRHLTKPLKNAIMLRNTNGSPSTVESTPNRVMLRASHLLSQAEHWPQRVLIHSTGSMPPLFTYVDQGRKRGFEVRLRREPSRSGFSGRATSCLKEQLMPGFSHLNRVLALKACCGPH